MPCKLCEYGEIIVGLAIAAAAISAPIYLMPPLMARINLVKTFFEIAKQITEGASGGNMYNYLALLPF